MTQKPWWRWLMVQGSASLWLMLLISGLSACVARSSSSRCFTHILFFSWILLYCTPRCDHRRRFGQVRRCNISLSLLSKGFCAYTCKWIFLAKATCNFTLSFSHSIIRSPEWALFISSITESKHIRAVKEPWHRSNQNVAIFQMLRTNQHLDQLSAAHVDFTKQGMLSGTLLESVVEANGNDTTSTILFLISL